MSRVEELRMLGCLIVDHVKGDTRSNYGKIILVAVADVLLTKLIFDEWRSEEKSDELYRSRFKYFTKQVKENTRNLKISSWFQVAMIPIGLSAKTLDEAQHEARRCLRVMELKAAKEMEGEIIASLVFLGKEGLDKEVIPYFLEEEYQINLNREKTAFGHALKSLLAHESFDAYIEKICVYKQLGYRMMCGGVGQVYCQPLPSKWVNDTLDDLDGDIKSMSLSFMRTFNCLPSF